MLTKGHNADAIIVRGTDAYAKEVSESWVFRDAGRPTAVFEADSPQSVQDAVRCATGSGLPFCARNGGHSKTGSSLCEGVMIDLHGYSGVSWNRQASRAYIKAGTTLGEAQFWIVNQTNKFLVAGNCPQAGISGVTLGGGLNSYEDEFGLACDSLVQLRMVLPSGQLVNVRRQGNFSDLFWASCGSGGSFVGVVTDFVMKLQRRAKYDRNVIFRYDWNLSVAPQVLSAWRLHLSSSEDKKPTIFQLKLTRGRLRGYGVCWNAFSTRGCEKRLEATPMFAAAWPKKMFTQATSSLLYPMMFHSKAGRYGTALPKISPAKAMLNQQFAVRGGSNGVSWGNVVWRRGSDLLPWEYAQLIELCNSQVVSACSWRPLGSQTKRVPLKATAFYMRGGDAILYANFRKLDPAYESARWQFYRILSNVNFGSYLNYGDLTLHNYSRM